MTAASEAASGNSAQEESSDLLWQAFACSGSAILVTKVAPPDCPVVFANPAFCRMTGYSLDEIVGRDCRFLQNGDRAQPSLDILREAIAAGRSACVTMRNYRKDGTLFWNQLHISPIALNPGKISHYVGVVRDVTAENQYEELLTRRAMCHPLTNLPNLQFVEDRLTAAIYEAKRTAGSVGLLVINIDNFKLINDSIGQHGADELLKAAADRLRNAVSGERILQHHGADEFAVIFQGADDPQAARALSEDLSLALTAAPYVIDGKSVRITCSMGIAAYPKDAASAADLVRHADIAMHRAKELGGNNVQFFLRELREHIAVRLEIETALREAIEDDELALHYQPQVDLQTGCITGFEALVRWDSPRLGQVEPARFIPIAEECGVIDALTEWVLRRACRDMRRWADTGLPDVRVAINVSPHQFQDPCLPDKICRIVEESGIRAGQLSLEVTEGVLMQDTPLCKETLARIQAMGIELALDDFGTGYSSLGYLNRYFFSKIKIDRSFIHNIASPSDDGTIAKTVISMAHSLGMGVIAEGVETEAQCDFLRRNMCDAIQGFLFSRAVPAPNAEQLLREERMLPAHLLRFSKPDRVLLIVDDEVNIVAALKRLLRHDGYTLLAANSGAEGLAILEKHAVDVIISDQRMPGMTGVEFLGKVKDIWPDTVRIVLSGYTELKSVTEAINKGAIYKFLTKPWDDAQLRAHIAEAFRRKEMVDENRRLSLEVQTANFELIASNRRLSQVLDQQNQQLQLNQVSLDVVRELLLNIPTPVIGLDEDNTVAFVNNAAQHLFAPQGLMLGGSARDAIPELLESIDCMTQGEARDVEVNESAWWASVHRMGQGSQSRGRMIAFHQKKKP